MTCNQNEKSLQYGVTFRVIKRQNPQGWKDKRRQRLKGGQLSQSSDGCKVISGNREGIQEKI